MASRKHKYREVDEIFIENNYSKFGLNYCIKNTHLSRNVVLSIITKKRLKRAKEKINIDLNNKFFCYLLGLIWSDGTIYKYKKSDNRIALCMVSEDMYDILPHIKNICNWSILHNDNKKRKCKDTITLRITDSDFRKFLIRNDYLNKSYISADKILNLIPDNNIRYFLRGIIDGDGCFYLNKNNYQRYISICSSYEQDWTYMEKVSKKLGCKYHIIKSKFKGGKSSTFKMCNKNSILSFGTYIYEDFFGIKRKYDKFLEIKSSYS